MRPQRSGGRVTRIPCGMRYRARRSSRCVACDVRIIAAHAYAPTPLAERHADEMESTARGPAKMQVDVMKMYFAICIAMATCRHAPVILVQINPPHPSVPASPSCHALPCIKRPTRKQAHSSLRRLPRPIPSSIPADKREETHPRRKVGLDSKTPDPCPGAQGRANGLTPDSCRPPLCHNRLPSPRTCPPMLPFPSQNQKCPFQKPVGRGVVP